MVVGSGPNGLAAAITLARAGCSVIVFEARETIGGGVRTAELTLPGFLHDVCSAIHPLGAGSPFFRTLPLAEHGLKWIYPPAGLAHPFDDGAAAVLENSIASTAQTLGVDTKAYVKLMAPLLADWEKLAPALLGPLRFPRHPLALARFGFYAMRSACNLAKSFFTGERGRGLLAGLAAHSIMSLDQPITAAFGLVLGICGHAIGWPMPRGGAQSIAKALASYLISLGGRIVTGERIDSVDELPPARAVLFDVTPRQLLRLAGHRLPLGYRRKLERYRYGPGVFKMDWALARPIPFKSAGCGRAGTIHLGGTLEEIAAAERMVWDGGHPEKPFVLLAQPSLFDSTRAPQGKHTAWAYCHVPNGSTVDMAGRIEEQIERFAPRFRECILGRHVMKATDFEQYNANYIGGDINGGIQDIRQFMARPVLARVPYATPARGVYLCSSSTPPGGGVHGMCGYHAASAALKELGKPQRLM